MMTHSYYNGGGGDYDPYYRSHDRNMSHAVYYDRLAPYGYQEPMPRHEHRSEHPGRAVARTMIHEPEHTTPGEQSSRKRISVACRRCRKRKIKCSGDLGDGLGCSACRHAGADGAQCAFIRVGAKECSEVLPLPGVEITAVTTSANAPPVTSNEIEVPPNTTWSVTSSVGYGVGHSSHRPSLPTLHTRATFPDLESHYQHPPLDGHVYASAAFPRQDSFVSTYGLENYRSWSTTAPAQAPVTATYYEPLSSYSFGSLQAPSFPQVQHHATRFPGLTADSISPFHMSHLNSSLPVHAAYERRLPIPTYNMHYPQSQQMAPQVRPLGSYTEPRVHINGIHSRNAMLWSIDSVSSGRAGSIASYALPSGLPPASAPSTSASSEPVLGYQFSHPVQNTESSSPEPSPTSAATVADSFSSSSSNTSIPPRSNLRYPAMSSAGYSLPGMVTDERLTNVPRAPPSLFSFSTESSERHMSESEQNSNDDGGVARGETSYSTPIRQPQLSHASSADAFQRSSPYEQQRASAVHRMSLSNINTNY